MNSAENRKKEKVGKEKMSYRLSHLPAAQTPCCHHRWQDYNTCIYMIPYRSKNVAASWQGPNIGLSNCENPFQVNRTTVIPLRIDPWTKPITLSFGGKGINKNGSRNPQPPNTRVRERVIQIELLILRSWQYLDTKPYMKLIISTISVSLV